MRNIGYFARNINWNITRYRANFCGVTLAFLLLFSQPVPVVTLLRATRPFVYRAWRWWRYCNQRVLLSGAHNVLNIIAPHVLLSLLYSPLLLPRLMRFHSSTLRLALSPRNYIIKLSLPPSFRWKMNFIRRAPWQTWSRSDERTMGLIICLFALESQFTNRFLDSREFLTLQLNSWTPWNFLDTFD